MNERCNKGFKRIIFGLFVLFLLIMPAKKTMAATILQSGSSGDISWSIDSDGVLTLDGDGTLARNQEGRFAIDDTWIYNPVIPWKQYPELITSARVRITGADNLCRLLSGLTNLRQVDFSGSDTSNVISMANMFSNCPNLETVDLSGFDIRKTKELINMFGGDTKLSYVNVSGLDTGEVLCVNSMFEGCTSLTKIDGLNTWNTRNIHSAFGMFQNCKVLKQLDLSNWDTSNLENVIAMFGMCLELESVNVGRWNTSKLTYTDAMFNCCTKLGNMDLTGWDTSHFVTADRMFGWCYNLNGGITIQSNIKSYENMFYAASIYNNAKFEVGYLDGTYDTAKNVVATSGYPGQSKVQLKGIPEFPEVNNSSGAVYRLYCPVNGEHLFTADRNEVKILVGEYQWKYEGCGWFAPDTGTPVYRLFNPALNNHLYTSDSNEVKVLTSTEGWSIDNNGNPVFYSGGTTNIYRLYNKGLNGAHLLTTDGNEYSVLPEYGWEQEGVTMKCEKIG